MQKYLELSDNANNNNFQFYPNYFPGRKLQAQQSENNAFSSIQTR